MAQRGTLLQILSELRKGASDANALFYQFTGKRFRDVFSRGMELYGEDLVKEMEKLFLGHKEEEDLGIPGLENPYRNLDVEPDARDIVVRGAFRSLAREYHPDTGIHPDAQRFQKVVESYNAIMLARAEVKRKKHDG